MSSAAIIAIAIGVAVVLAAVVFVTTARRSDVRGAGALSNETRRRDDTARRARVATESEAAAGGCRREPCRQRRGRPHRRGGRAGREQARHPTPVLAPPAALVPWVPPDPEAIGVSRRQFFNRATVTLTSAGIGAFAAAGFVAFLWPTATGGFGQVVNVGKLDDIKEGARANVRVLLRPVGAHVVHRVPGRCACPRQRASTTPPPTSNCRAYGVIALYQKCPHLGCRVPDCETSRWFECPCHGSQYNQVGEKKGGPAPRGMSRFLISVDASQNVNVDTSTPIDGPPIGTNTTGQEAEGPHCITGAGEH